MTRKTRGPRYTDGVRGSFRLGISPARDVAATRARALLLADAIGEVLRRPVELHAAPDYRSLVASMSSGDTHLAWLPPLAAAEAVGRGAIRPLAVAVRGGRSAYGSALFTRADGKIVSVADLRGVRAAWVDVQSAGGYAAIRAALRAQGVRLVDAFSQETFLRSYTEVARAVLEGRADVGATHIDREDERVLDAGWRGVAEDSAFRVVAECASIPSDFFGVHAAASDTDVAMLDAAFVDARPALVHRLAKELAGAARFVRATPAWSSALRDLADETAPSSHQRDARGAAPAGDVRPSLRRRSR